MRPSRAIVSVRVFLYAALTAVLSACAGSTSDFDRVAPPVRFADIRETASWVGSFDPAWWSTIDAAFAEYDRSLDGALVASWDSFCADAADERVRGLTPDSRRARVLASKYADIDRQLAERERLFVAALERSLPRASEPFVSLLGARMAFHRATGILREPGQRLPAPLEVMQLVGRAPLADAQVAVAASAYARLASDGATAVRKRVQRYLDACKELEPMLGELAAAEAAERSAPDDAARKAAADARDRATKSRDAAVAALDKDSQRTLEALRVALLREGRLFAQVIGDPDQRSAYIEQLDFALFDGIRAAPGIEAFARIARIAIARAFPDDTKALEELDAIVEEEVARSRTLRVALASASPDARRNAYEALQKVGEPVGSFVDRKLKQYGGLWRVLERTVDVMAGAQSAETAASLVLSPPPPEPAPPEPYLPPGRDRNLLILMGSPLLPGALESLLTRLRIEGDSANPLRELVREQTEALGKAGKTATDAIGSDFRDLGRARDLDPASAVREFMSKLDSHLARVRSEDQAATERVLAEAARAAGVAVDDERIEIARIELDLLLEVGADRDMREVEPIVGVLSAAIVNPFDLVRLAARNDEERAAAEDILLANADGLRAAQRELAVAIRRNLRAFMVELLRGGGFGGFDRSWRPQPVGAAAARLRLRLAREFRVALGEDFAERYEARMRELVLQGADPRRPAAIAALERFASGAGLLPADRAATADDRAVVAELLAQAKERRVLALRELLEWRAEWIRLGDLRDRESWRELERVAPRGWLLRSRVADADERALAACAAALDGAGAGELGLRAFPVVMPRRMRPFFE